MSVTVPISADVTNIGTAIGEYGQVGSEAFGAPPVPPGFLAEGIVFPGTPPRP